MAAGIPTVGKQKVKAAIVAAQATQVEKSIHAKLDDIITAVGAGIKTDESAAKVFIKKYWPIAIGIGIALTRLIRL